jgi:hypothetical protein
MATPHVTTDETLQSDLLASLIKEDLESRGLCVHRSAEKTARLCVSLFEPDTYDAAVWKAAEAIYKFMDGRSEAIELIHRDHTARSMYVWLAIQSIAAFRLALEGGFDQARMAEAYAAITNHKGQLGARAEAMAKVIPFTGERNGVA